MPLLLTHYSRRLLVSVLALRVFAASALARRSQTPASPTAPTASEDPVVIDRVWQKASAKCDVRRTTILNEVDRVVHQGPFRFRHVSLCFPCSLRQCGPLDSGPIHQGALNALFANS